MTTPLVSSTPTLFLASRDESNAPATRTYRTKTSFVAVHFHPPGKGRIVFLSEGATLGVIGPSSCLPEGSEVMYESRVYNVFNVDLAARSSQIGERVRVMRRAVAACA
jgi:hypothetical protein